MNRLWTKNILPIVLVVQDANEENIQRATQTLNNFYKACYSMSNVRIAIKTLVCSTKCRWLEKNYKSVVTAKKYQYKVKNTKVNLEEMVESLNNGSIVVPKCYKPIVFFFLTNDFIRTTFNSIKKLNSSLYQTVIVNLSDSQDNDLLMRFLDEKAITTITKRGIPKTSKYFYSLLIAHYVKERSKPADEAKIRYTLDYSLIHGPTPILYQTGTLESIDKPFIARPSSEIVDPNPHATEPYFKNTGLINYAIISEHEIKRNEPFIIDFITFIDKYKIIVASYMDNFKDPAVKKGVLSDVKENSEITIRFYAPDVPSINGVQTFVWDGKYNVSEFHGLINDSYKGNSLLLAFDVLVNGIKIAAIKSVVDLEKNSKGIMKLFKEDVRRVFFSYSSKDRKTVLQIVKKTVDITGSSIHFFLDALSLRAGDNWQDKIYEAIDDCDSFCLIWSYSAYRSKWVKKEWEYALDKKGLHVFNPININNEKKHHVPIPRKLSSIHFANYNILIKNI